MNAFTHFFEPPTGTDDEVTILFWALVAIETLYTRGQQGLQEQVREKSQIFLGKQTTHKKVIGQMYNFRSRYVHGDLNVTGSHSYPSDDNSNNQNEEMFDAIFLAEAILVATFQKLIQLDWSGLTFSYQVSDSS